MFSSKTFGRHFIQQATVLQAAAGIPPARRLAQLPSPGPSAGRLAVVLRQHATVVYHPPNAPRYPPAPFVSRSVSAAVVAASTASLRILYPFLVNDPRNSVQRLRPIRPHRLLGQMAEQLLDESGLYFVASRQKLCQISPSIKMLHLARSRQIASRRIHRPVVVLFAETAHGVKMFQREAERVDDAVTGQARRRLGLETIRSRVVRSGCGFAAAE